MIETVFTPASATFDSKCKFDYTYINILKAKDTDAG